MDDAIAQASEWLTHAPPGGNTLVENVVKKVVALSGHRKWEVRLAVARLAAENHQAAFGPVLERLENDENKRVRLASQAALSQRRDQTRSSVFTRQHEDQISAILDGIGRRFGTAGRVAVGRASEKIADTFARELSHELVRLLTPMTFSVEKLRAGLNAGAVQPLLARELDVLEARVKYFGDVLSSTRNYTAQATLSFSGEPVSELIRESVALIEGKWGRRPRPQVLVRGLDHAGAVEVCRTRIIQALVNLLENSLEAYGGGDLSRPVVIEVSRIEARVVIVVSDQGCGMSPARLVDARRLFATSKPGGTGFGLPLAIKIIQSEHLGALSIESEEGRGTKVRVALPTRQPIEDES